MTPAFIASDDSLVVANNYYRPAYARGYNVLLNVSNGTVHETYGDTFRPFLAENKTNVINVHWYQYAAATNNPPYAFAGRWDPLPEYADTMYANWSTKNSSPQIFYLKHLDESLESGTGVVPAYFYSESYQYAATTTLAGSTASIGFFANSPYTITSCRIAARPLGSMLAPYAFNVAATVATTSLIAANQICTSAPLPTGYQITTAGFMPRVTFTVTQFSQDLLDRSAAQIRAGQSGNVELRAQIQTVVSPISPYNPSWTGVATTPFWVYPSVITLMSDHFPLTFAAPLTRPAYYGA